MVPPKLTIEALNQASPADFVAALANVVEHSAWVAEAVERQRPYADAAGLRAALVNALGAAVRDQRLAMIRAHPDLADRTQRASGLTAESTAEQDGAGLDRLSDREFALFTASNDAYKTKFGFPFILCVRRHTKDSILDVFARRLANTVTDEEGEAIGEIGRIATLRLAELLADPEPLQVYGRLSTHVLDTHAGRPAIGVGVELFELSRYGEPRIVAKASTDENGRTHRELIADRPVPIGRYELRFETAAYYRLQGVVLSEPPFFDVVPIRFAVAEPDCHMHIPLLLTPWGYTTYRGS
jgi:2-oxo-4-hydroxy-4-carboxy-5-ureidoimidazoline decarboxylase